MANLHIYRKGKDEPKEAYVKTGETIDDSKRDVKKYLTMLRKRDGWDYKAEPQ